MRRWLILCVILGGCGFQSEAAGGGTSDGGIDGTGSGGTDSGSGSGSDSGSGGPTDCFQHWLDHSVTISASTVQEVTELSSAGNGNDRNPWISDDGMRMYFSRDQGTPNTSDIFFASRGSTAMAFDPPTALVNLNSNGHEGRVWLTPDELTLAVSSERGGPQDIQIVTRPDAGQGFGSPDRNHLMKVNGVGTERDDPFLMADGLRLYLSSNSGPAGRQQLLFATRSATDVDFGAPSVVPGFRNDMRNMGDPTPYQDERLLVFSILEGGGNADLWYATRASTADDFGSPVQIPGVNNVGAEVDPMLTGDGCELYFASTRRDGKLHIFHAQVTK